MSLSFVLIILFFIGTPASAAPWQGSIPTDVTPSGYGHDVSGAVWNPVTATLWTSENNPGVVRKASFNATSSQWVVDQSWEPGGDLESITLRGFDETSVFVGVERDGNNHRLIREYSTIDFTLIREWDLISMLAGSGNNGLEALTFVPDAFLTAMQFVNLSGDPYEASRFGTGGLFFAGHQATGEIFVFDLDRSETGTDLAHVHVTTIDTGKSEIAALEFDSSNGLLYAWHDANINVLQLFGSDDAGHFSSLANLDNPFCCNWNIEGLALTSNSNCSEQSRSLLFTRDQDGSTDPSLYEDVRFPCDCNGNALPDSLDISSGFSSDSDQNGIPDECEASTTSVATAGHTDSFVLHGNAPNPFNPRTVIRFELHKDAHVKLSIFDVHGRNKYTLLSRFMLRGVHQATWAAVDRQGRPMASGVYFYQLLVGNSSQTRRMVLLQ